MARAQIPVSRYEFQNLNERFYRMAPYRYLDTRLRSLILTVSDTVDTAAIWDAGVGYKNLRITDTDGTDRKELDEYLVLESTVLLHHACEAMLRLYLAHAYRAECPWLNLSSTTSPRDFKLKVKELGRELDDPSRVADVLEVFSYTPNSEGFDGINEEAWESHTKGLVRLLRHAIEEITGNANAYNAAKHGLAVMATELGVKFGADGENPLIDHQGPTINYLEMAGNTDDRHWRLNSTWVDPMVNMGVGFLVMAQIKSLWTVARAHRKIDEPQIFHPISIDKVEAVLELNAKIGFNLTGLYERLHSPEDESHEPAERDERFMRPQG
ncbi:hypothetical protein [Cryobacterium sp. M91]|uniref:hypothetical protein n=1 Tax=Cryobacterium sp. M91 TaxID=2048294 RepID=UPI000CE31BBD|nr:hypothetical protein [Cryobacterium sp. M91]